MIPVINKPYVWVDLSSQSPQIIVRLWNDEGLGISYRNGLYSVAVIQDAYVISLYLLANADFDSGTDDPSGVSSKTVIALDDPGLPTRFDPALHSKVTIMIVKDTGDLLGFQTYLTREIDYSCYQSTVPTLRPFIWMQSEATDDATVHVALEASNYYDAAISDPPVDVLETFTREINVQIEPVIPIDPDDPTKVLPEAEEVLFLDALLDETTDFDPVFDRIEVTIFEQEGSVNSRKGGGTSQTSEGDASGDD